MDIITTLKCHLLTDSCSEISNTFQKNLNNTRTFYWQLFSIKFEKIITKFLTFSYN